MVVAPTGTGDRSGTVRPTGVGVEAGYTTVTTRKSHHTSSSICPFTTSRGPEDTHLSGGSSLTVEDLVVLFTVSCVDRCPTFFRLLHLTSRG